MSTGVIVGVLAAIILIYGLIVYLLIFRSLQPFAKKLLLVLVSSEIALAILHVIFVRQSASFWHWFFNLDLELAAGTMFSVAQYAIVALMALVSAIRTPSLTPGQRFYWGLLCGVFVWLGIDEFFSLHEGFTLWRGTYIIAGLIFLIVSGMAYWLGFRKQRTLFVALVVGLVVMGIGGVIFELYTTDNSFTIAGLRIDWFSCTYGLAPFACRHVLELSFSEEFYEMAGMSIILVGFLSYIESTQGSSGLRLAKWLIAGGAAIGLALFVGTLWVIPTVEAAIYSEPMATTDWADGSLSLVGYHLSSETPSPGDDLTVTLYLRANTPVRFDYGASVHLLTRIEAESISSSDIQLGQWRYPTSAWLPGVSIGSQAYLHLPEDIPTPRSYWLTLRVWHQDGDTTLSQTDRQQIAPDTIILLGLPVLSSEAPPAPPTPAAYHFTDGFSLIGYDLPQTSVLGESLPLAFWWQTEAPVAYELNQFVHLIGQSSEDVLIYDQPPFGENDFPTSDWPARMEEVAQWDIQLPTTLTPGTYDVYTGLYTPNDLERRAIFDEEGEPVLNNEIHLGEIVLEAR